MTVRAQPPRPTQASHTSQVTTGGPLGFVLAVTIGLIPTTFAAWMLGLGIELVGMHFWWRDAGIQHSRAMVIQDLEYIAAAPTSLIVDDTVGFARELLNTVAQPFIRLGVVRYYTKAYGATTESAPAQSVAPRPAAFDTLRRLRASSSRFLADVGMVALYTAQETALRLAIAAFAMPAFLLACLLGAVDGLVRRDLRRWGGGRESSFVYHHAKALTALSLGGGFSLYLAWPFGGFNPAHMVMVFTALVAWSLSLTLASFKKYL